MKMTFLCCVCRKTDQKKVEAGKAWKGRKYALILVQPNGEQLHIIGDHMKEVRFEPLNPSAQLQYSTYCMEACTSS